MPVHFDVDEEFKPGKAWFASISPRGGWAVVFEDDGSTGYFYAVECDNDGNMGAVLDALHIYNVKGLKDRKKPSRLVMGWSHSGDAAVLLINQYPHAIFDRANQRATSRTGFPPPDPQSLFKRSHEWDPTLEESFY